MHLPKTFPVKVNPCIPTIVVTNMHNYQAVNDKKTTSAMNTEQLTNPLVKAAIVAMTNGDRTTWTELFTPDAIFTDDGHTGSISAFTAGVFGKGKEHFTRIDKVANDGLDIYGQYHSDQWGDFKTFFKFGITNGKIFRLDVGQADY
ncbi:hypothetical protein [Chitinophaga nivalis]|uniref:SnoaL-like domain-containing protein n=1 Tax=Chitinophaga nivalis TaxID=2991709 RepID=A0ABT3IJF8_9BACT|nr:hypothetical protein [Chitinophaga nivalis]MCW3466217.1 hypothetical protein [Chitinophaga nivalis]MCW3484092.1 hypothetical protein [Chitinophaga nivalis]